MNSENQDLKIHPNITKIIYKESDRKVFNYILNPLNIFRNFHFWTMFFIMFGIIIRLVQYFNNRSLWADESLLALNVINKSFFELLKPLDYHQGAPFGFLVITKLFALILGDNEFALRLFPLVTGIASIFLFFSLSKKFLNPFAIFVAVGLFSIAEPLYYYSSEFKQYSSDVFFTLILFSLFAGLKNKGTSFRNLIIFSLAGAITIWFSHPSVFVLAGIGITALTYYYIQKDWKSFTKVLAVSFIWFLSFATFYILSLQNLSNDGYMTAYWDNSFLPLLPKSYEDINWFINTFFGTFTFFMTSALSGVASLFFILGVTILFKERKELFFILILPIIITLLVSGFYLYPFKGRLILFLVPSFLLFISAGINHISELTKIRPVITFATVILIFSFPFYNSSKNLIKPIERSEIKQTLSYLKKNIRTDDEIYLYYGSKPAFDFYKEKFALSEYNIIKGKISRNEWRGYANDLDQLKTKKRVWIIFSHILERTNEKWFFLYYLNTIGKLAASYKAFGSEIYLYDFSNFSSTTNNFKSASASDIKTEG